MESYNQRSTHTDTTQHDTANWSRSNECRRSFGSFGVYAQNVNRSEHRNSNKRNKKRCNGQMANTHNHLNSCRPVWTRCNVQRCGCCRCECIRATKWKKKFKLLREWARTIRTIRWTCKVLSMATESRGRDCCCLWPFCCIDNARLPSPSFATSYNTFDPIVSIRACGWTSKNETKFIKFALES